MVQVEDGETIVMGGVYEADNVTTLDTIPWISDLPLVGWMFKKTNKNEERRGAADIHHAESRGKDTLGRALIKVLDRGPLTCPVQLSITYSFAQMG